MSEKNEIVNSKNSTAVNNDRREFLKKAGNAAIAAPATIVRRVQFVSFSSDIVLPPWFTKSMWLVLFTEAARRRL